MRLWKSLVVPYILVLVILIIAFTSLKSESEGERWTSRKLTKGEPSGERQDGRTTVSSSISVDGKSRQDLFGVAGSVSTEKSSSIRITVTLPSKYANLADNKSSNRLEVYKKRKLEISKTCRKYGLGRFSQTADEDADGGRRLETSMLYRQMEDTFSVPVENSFMWEKNWHLLYCWIHKVASSSWSQVFFNLVGKQVPASRLHEAAQFFHPTSADLSEAVTNSLVFTFVRHPFERLVSAFRDKFELAKKSAYVYSRFAAKVLRTPKLRLTSRRPTFREFADYLIREPVSEYNDHWVPYWLHCHLCQMEYDVVGKMETLGEDIEFITGVTGLSSTNITMPWTNRHNSGSNVSLQYFSSLDLDTVKALHRIYSIDFDMFGYDVQPYLDLFKP